MFAPPFATETALRFASKRPFWAALLVAVLLFGLLLAFQRVVHGAVQQGELRRRATALLHEATWRCNALRERAPREACLQHIRAVPDDNPRLGDR